MRPGGGRPSATSALFVDGKTLKYGAARGSSPNERFGSLAFGVSHVKDQADDVAARGSVQHVDVSNGQFYIDVIQPKGCVRRRSGETHLHPSGACASRLARMYATTAVAVSSNAPTTSQPMTCGSVLRLMSTMTHIINAISASENAGQNVRYGDHGPI